MSSALLEGIVEHMVIVSIAVLISTVLGVILGVIAYWVRFLDSVILWVSEVLQTITSLALLALLMIIFGIGDINLVLEFASSYTNNCHQTAKKKRTYAFVVIQ